MKSTIKTIAEEVSLVLSHIKEDEAYKLVTYLKHANRIFVYGEGRSGLMGKAFAMRLMHGGFPVFVIGETITPSIGKDDLFVAISGSGLTGTLQQMTRKAKEAEAKVFLVTANESAEVMEVCDGTMIVPAATKHRRGKEPSTIQPLGNQFDQSVHLLLDAVVIKALQTEGQPPSYEKMVKRHTNLE